MSDALSQEEIDALKEAVSTGAPIEEAPKGNEAPVQEEEPQEQVKVVAYDFRKPKLISAESLHVVEMLHQESAKIIEAFVLAELKVTGSVSLTTLDQISYGEFVMATVPPAYVVRVQAGELGNVAMEISMTAVTVMLDVLLGGDGESKELGREMTALEKSVMGDILAGIVERIRSSWSVLADLEFTVEDVMSNAEYLNAAGRETPCLNLSYDVNIGSTEGLMNVCYPIELVQKIIKKSESTGNVSAAQDSRKGMLKAIGGVPLNVRAVLGDIVISAEELGKLEVGDVVCMDKRIDEPVDMMLDDMPMFSGYLGKQKDKKAVELMAYRRPKEDGS